MPYYETSQEWFEQSALLLQAYPTTAITTTKFKILPPDAIKPRKRKAATDNDGTPSSAEPTQPPPNSSTNTSTANATAPSTAPMATLTLKTYDPVSGACLKYRTDKAAEVGRLVASLGRLGRHMAALPDADVAAAAEDVVMAEAQEEVVEGTKEAVAQKGEAGGAEAKGAASGAGGAPPAKKKKKGKK